MRVFYVYAVLGVCRVSACRYKFRERACFFFNVFCFLGGDEYEKMCRFVNGYFIVGF